AVDARAVAGSQKQSGDGVAAVDGQALARDEVGGAGSEEDGRAGALLRLAKAAGRSALDYAPVGGLVGLEAGRHVGRDPAGDDAIHLDIVAGPGDGEGLRELDDAALARRVGQHGGAAEKGVLGADVDDLAASVRDHVGVTSLRELEDRLEVGVQDPVPDVVGNGFRAPAGRHARIVDQDANAAQLLTHRFDGTLDV